MALTAGMPPPLCAGLRDHAAQGALSELAALPNVHLAASVDHANAALLWDLQVRKAVLHALRVMLGLGLRSLA